MLANIDFNNNDSYFYVLVKMATKPLLKKMQFSIRTRLLFSFGFVILFTLIFGGLAKMLFHNIEGQNAVYRAVNELGQQKSYSWSMVQTILLTDYSDAQLLTKGKNQHTTEFMNSLSRMKSLLNSKELLDFARTDDNIFNQLIQIQFLIKEYQGNFGTLIDKLKERGFKDMGLEGTMRNQVHFLEDNEDLIGMANVLMLRRHEKDFLLRKDMIYADRLEHLVESLKSEAEANELLTDEQKGRANEALSGYLASFKRIVKIEQELGFDQNTGIKGELEKNGLDLDLLVTQFQSKINANINETVSGFNQVFIITFTLIVLFSILVAFYNTQMIARPLNLLNQALQAVEQGADDIKPYINKIKTEDEIQGFAKSFGKMFDSLNNTLANVNQKSVELEKLLAENNQRTWRNEGLNILGQVLRNQEMEFEGMLDEFLSKLVRYTEISQGALFVIYTNPSGTEIKQEATFAFDKKKFITTTLKPGEGLVGQCYRERKPIYLTDVPANYAQITTGLGTTPPRNVVIIPAIFNDVVYAIIELADFKMVEAHKLELIHRACDTLAVSLASIMINRQTKTLLGETQKMATELKNQEEVLRQNFEELQATQEEMERHQRDTTQRENILRSVLNSTEDVILALDHDFRVLTFNQACERKFESLFITLSVGIDFLATIRPENREQCALSYKRALTGARFTTLEQFNENGVEVFVQSHYAPIYNDKGSIIGLSIVSRQLNNTADFSLEKIDQELPARQVKKLNVQELN